MLSFLLRGCVAVHLWAKISLMCQEFTKNAFIKADAFFCIIFSLTCDRVNVAAVNHTNLALMKAVILTLRSKLETNGYLNRALSLSAKL